MKVVFPLRDNKTFKVMMMFLIVWGISFHVQEQFDFTSLLEGRMALADEVKSIDNPSYIKGIELTEQEKDSIVTIKASKPLTYTVIKLKEPLKIVVDIPEFTVEPAIEPVKVNSEVISEIINKQLEKGERKFSRIEISLNRDVNYNVTTKLSDLIIRIAKPVKIVEKDKKVVGGMESKQVEDLPESDKGKKVVDLEINKDLDGMTVITDNAISKYNAFLLENPYRLVVDIPGVKHLLPKNIFSFESSFVTKLKIGQHPEKVRLAVYFQDKLPGYKIEKDKNKLFVTWEKPAVVEKGEGVEVVAAEAIPVKEEKAEEVVEEEGVKEEVVKEDKKEEKKDVVAAEAIPVKEEKVEEVVEKEEKIEKAAKEDKEDKEDIVVAAEAIPVKGEKSEEVVKNESSEEKEEVKVKEEVKEIAEFPEVAEISQEVTPVKEEKLEEKKEEVQKITEMPEVAKTSQEVIPIEREGLEEERKVYTGQKISLDFKDADIRNILRLIADISGLNIIVSENVKGKVTIKLENIPWDEVLNIILETNNLGKLWMGSVLRIETQEEIRRISEEKYRAQKSQEKVADLKSVVVDIVYRDAKDVADLLAKEKELTSDRGAISVDPNLNRLIITDTPEKIDNIKIKITRYDDRTVRQVFIEAKIIQSIPTFTKEIGIAWGGPYTTTGHGGKEVYAVGGAGGITFEKEEVKDPITGFTSEVLKKVISNGNMIDLAAPAGMGTGGGIGFGIIKNNLELTATLTAMEKDEKLKIISNPRILSIDKNEAMIKQGVALPYLKLSEEGVTSTEFKDAVLELKVTPTILSEKIIKIELKVKKDQKSAQTGAGGEPGIDVRETQTVLMVENGRTVVIGGIYEETTTIIKSGVPFFSDIPGIGRLFRNDFSKKELTELLIFLTTTIVPSEIIGIDSEIIAQSNH